MKEHVNKIPTIPPLPTSLEHYKLSTEKKLMISRAPNSSSDVSVYSSTCSDSSADEFDDSEEICIPKELLPKNGCRRGKWTVEEERFTERIIEDFSMGILNLKHGTTLRNFLSSVLNCDPMRITKKYTGDYSIGKRVFIGADLRSFSSEFLERRSNELQYLKDTWFKALLRAEKERMEQFSDKSKLGKMSSFLADLSSSSTDGHFNVCRIESVLIATDLSQEEVKQTVEWLKKAQLNLINNSSDSIDNLSNAIDEGDKLFPSLKLKINKFLESGKPMNLVQSQLYFEQKQQEQSQTQQQTLKSSLDSHMEDSANSLTDIESCYSNQSPSDTEMSADRYMGDVFTPTIDNIFNTSKNPLKRPREFSALSVMEQMEIEKTAGLLMRFGVPSVG